MKISFFSYFVLICAVDILFKALLKSIFPNIDMLVGIALTILLNYGIYYALLMIK